ncbi:MAG: hypothetical protein BJBARM5_0271 [Candidatus Parvarchaeum acidophilus ARMAN-5]|jgi:uncharacterized membrane protein|uniref:Uncharacterized protein n=1 Tax=Candidatus Parvarchaeum acidophilus ARMAN-5 TaxID=662762 RepID=D6GUX2_PARA5|nr:MAG: hypothetical protein BJBARM5_0271 [Candidatus Parvarchaeum acidophilus ARMAN-5]
MSSAVLISLSSVNPLAGFIIPLILIILVSILLVVSLVFSFKRFYSNRVANIQRISLFKSNWWRVGVLFLMNSILTAFLIAGLFFSQQNELYFFLYGLLITLIVSEIFIISIFTLLSRKQSNTSSHV